MGYYHRVTKRIAVHYSGSESYPASQNGGRVSYSGTAYEDVTVNIYVETDPFERSIGSCNTNVGLLTGAVVATEGAQIASIRENARKVGETIVSGFFKTVSSEISQQISELSSKIDATTNHLHELAKRCLDKQRQMEVDYKRISLRYQKVFEDLNTELENRIYELDKPAFKLKRECAQNVDRISSDDTAGATIVVGEEGSNLQKTIAASVVKNQAKNTINEITRFLQGQNRLDTILRNCILDSDTESMIYMPVCFIESVSDNDSLTRRAYGKLPNHISEDQLVAELSPKQWSRAIPNNDTERIRGYFNNEISNHYTSADMHETRVRDYISQLFNIDTAKSL